MQVACPSCARTLEYSGERPRFCSFCRSGFATAVVAPAQAPASEDRTVAPSSAPAPSSEDRTVAPSDDWAPHQPVRAAGASATVDAPTRLDGDLGPGIPESVGGYRLLRRLGGGGMGAVYEAE